MMRDVEETSTQPLVEQNDLRSFGSLLRRQGVTIVLCGVVTAATTLGVSLLQAEQFQASARILYTDPGTTAGSIGAGDPARAIDTFTRLATTEDILQPVAKSLGFATADEVRADVTITGASNANLLDVSAIAGTAKGSAALANAVATSLIRWRSVNRDEQFKARITFLKQQLNALAGTTSPSQVAAASDLRTQLTEAEAQLSVPNPELTLVSPAAAPAAPFSPRPVRNALIGLIAGLLLGFAVGALRDRLDRKLHGTDDIEQVYPWPLLGVVPAVAGQGREAALADFGGMSNLADAYRNIRTNLSLLTRAGDGPRVWAISSAMPAEGKSATTANLAGALASTGLRVLAISADLHSPGLHEYFGIVDRSAPGLVEVLRGDETPEQAVNGFPVLGGRLGNGGRIDVIANARVFSDPAILFQSAAMGDLLASARKRYDAIVIDAPPLLYTAEASLLARLADGLILVARLELLTRHQAERAKRVLETMQLAPVGVIATGMTTTDAGYGAGYEYRQRPKEEASPRAEARATVRRA